MRVALWEAFFMLVVLKIPIVYVCLVVWWAVRAEPRPLEGAVKPVLPEHGPHSWRPKPPSSQGGRPRGRGPHGSPVRTYRRRSTPARAPVE